MLFNLPQREYFSLREVAEALDKHIGTIWRWTLRGVRGVRLETFAIGAQRYVTQEALNRFLAALNTGLRRSTPRRHRLEVTDDQRDQQLEGRLVAEGL